MLQAALKVRPAIQGARRWFSHTLVLADHDNSKLADATLSAVTAASKIGGKVTVVVAGQGCDAVAAQVLNILHYQQ